MALAGQLGTGNAGISNGVPGGLEAQILQRVLTQTVDQALEDLQSKTTRLNISMHLLFKKMHFATALPC